ncbi:hypothetical protein [Aquisphaera insulae]|uniref:hypothetical protein n=1 Tax=Aquisphaera insulae TaxID=2712864 RepID=UPI00196A5092|nr:hypothetical protein [Aquisphaera insulae]
MNSETVTPSGLAELIEGLRREIGRLGDRVAALEAATAAAGVVSNSSSKSDRVEVKEAAPASAAPAEGLSEELVLVIASAIAAFLGKKAHIRQISLIRTGAWAQEGRVTIQASHALSTLR